MYAVGLVLFFIHIVAFVIGGANMVLMPVLGPKLAKATPEVRASLMSIVEAVAKIGKYAMATLLITGVLVLWLKWGFNPPSPIWFWIKMAGIVAMLVFISLNEINAKKAKAGDMAAAANSKRFGQLTGVAFLVVVFSAVFAFN